MNFIEAFSWMVQDELDRRRSRLLDRRFTHSGLPERKTLEEIDWISARSRTSSHTHGLSREIGDMRGGSGRETPPAIAPSMAIAYLTRLPISAHYNQVRLHIGHVAMTYTTTLELARGCDDLARRLRRGGGLVRSTGCDHNCPCQSKADMC